MNLDDRARLRAHADDYENATDVHALLDHIDQLEAQLTEACATKDMHKDRYEDLLEDWNRVHVLITEHMTNGSTTIPIRRVRRALYGEGA